MIKTKFKIGYKVVLLKNVKKEDYHLVDGFCEGSLSTWGNLEKMAGKEFTIRGFHDRIVDILRVDGYEDWFHQNWFDYARLKYLTVREVEVYDEET